MGCRPPPTLIGAALMVPALVPLMARWQVQLGGSLAVPARVTWRVGLCSCSATANHGWRRCGPS
eukprot:scaffold35791_cov29-Phaeocystis_antarctica.AAC.1